ncbi:RNA 2'-phosphotransferase [bacterium]|nr:RNA 2'-phosphotransferase [bacterium]
MDRRDIELSKYLSLILRHQPELAGLSLDREGWAEIEALLAGAASRGRRISREQLERVVADNDKQRFAVSPDGLRIRAVQGHSARDVSISYEPQTPPKVLYHGTAKRFLESILAEGLRPGRRQHVHLSVDTATATSVGRRYGVPVVLRIAALCLHAGGHEFYCAENGVWLTDRVPVEAITLHDL